MRAGALDDGMAGDEEVEMSDGGKLPEDDQGSSEDNSQDEPRPATAVSVSTEEEEEEEEEEEASAAYSLGPGSQTEGEGHSEDGSTGDADDGNGADENDADDESDASLDMDAGTFHTEGRGAEEADGVTAAALSSPLEALQLARSATTHLRRALERRPDSCVYTACLAQLLVLMAHLTEIIHGEARGARGTAVRDPSAAGGGAHGGPVTVVTASDTDGGAPPPGAPESMRDMYLRSAEHWVHTLAHAWVPIRSESDEDDLLHPSRAQAGAAEQETEEPISAAGPATISLAPSAVARELWLHWVHRYAPEDLEARAAALLHLADVDCSSDRVRNELDALEPLLWDAQLSATEGSGDVSEGCEDVFSARRILPKSTIIMLVASRIEARPFELSSWLLLERSLARIMAPTDPTPHGTAVAADVDTPILQTAQWWAERATWWPAACFQVHGSWEPYGDSEPVVSAARAAADAATPPVTDPNKTTEAVQLSITRLESARLLGLLLLRSRGADGQQYPEADAATQELIAALERRAHSYTGSY